MRKELVIAIDGGGSGTRIGLYDDAGTLLAEKSGDASNTFARPPVDAAAYLSESINHLILGSEGKLGLVVAGVSGARSAAHREILARNICAATRARRVVVTTDVHAHLLGNAGQHPAVVVVSGTGSSIAVLDAQGVTSLLGGRGPILGDDGSAYHIVVAALRAQCRARDRDDRSPPLLSKLVRTIRAEHDMDLVTWFACTEKREIAALMETVVAFAQTGDALASLSIASSLTPLAELTHCAVMRARLDTKAPIYLAGGVFENFPYCTSLFEEQLRMRGVENPVLLTPKKGHHAVYGLANHLPLSEQVPHAEMTPLTAAMEHVPGMDDDDDGVLHLDDLSADEIAGRMFREDRDAYAATKACRKELALLMDRVVDAFRQGGRLIYVGAGTSGRMGVLDASECPPTFGVPASQVIGIIAGGDRALRESVEGAEDDTDLGRSDIEQIHPPIGGHDVVAGIAASGSTPYTLAAVAAARNLGAVTALICCNPQANADVDHLLILPTGTEVLPGSTRLKAGTATKMVLNTITTGAMALSGRVFEGYMIGVQPTNAKLHKRAVHIISRLTRIGETKAAELLAEAGNSVAVAVLMGRLHIGADDARALLDRNRGDVRAAIALRVSDAKTTT